MTEVSQLFDETRHYTQDDPLILDLLGSKEKQSQMRYYGRYPIHYKLGRKIVMTGHALNAWAKTQRINPNGKAAK